MVSVPSASAAAVQTSQSLAAAATPFAALTAMVTGFMQGITSGVSSLFTAWRPKPSASIANTSLTEGDTGTSNMAFTVTLSKASTSTVTIGYATSNGTATAGQDFTARSGTLTFAPGVTSQLVNVAVTGDTTVEPDETLTVTLSNTSGATIAHGTATGTIRNNDTAVVPPAVSVADASMTEGNSGSSSMAFTVTLSKASTSTVTIGYATSNGTATAGQDYTANTGTLTFAPGVTSQQATVAVTGDTTVEASETFTVSLSTPSGATIADGTATGTIVNDDSVAPGDTWGKSFFAPYVDMAAYPVPNLLQMSQLTWGTSRMVAGFITTDPNGKPAWSGLTALEPSATNSQELAINQSIAAFKAAGGDVMISFGGANAVSLPESYAAKGLSAQALANAYAGVLDTYKVNHIDLDIEGPAVNNAAAMALNNSAITLLQQARPDLKVWYTLAVSPTGLYSGDVAIMQAALQAGVKPAGVNIMAMDFGEAAAPTSGANAQTMGTYAIRSAEATYAQSVPMYAKYGLTFDWSQLGVTPMIGVNDVTTEVFNAADAQALEDFANTKGLGMIAMYSINRDTPGTSYSTTGTTIPQWTFSKTFSDYGTTHVVTAV